MSHSEKPYRGRLAPSPTGYLHLGHARTFWVAQERARANGGVLILRNDDLDSTRFKMEFVAEMIGDLRWFGFEWSEGPDCGGKFAPYNQSERFSFYATALEKLRAGNFVYPCTCSRRDIRSASHAPHANDDNEPVYPGTCRAKTPSAAGAQTSTRFNWRFRVPDGEAIEFFDGNLGRQRFIAGVDFGDFLVWRRDGVPSYQLACVVDDAAMGITEVVRGADLLKSTARQILLNRALGYTDPAWFHCKLVVDHNGRRLAKRHDALSLRALRQRGLTPMNILSAELPVEA